MKKSERILLAVALMAIGILAILLKDTFIGLLMTLLGGGLAVWGGADIFRKNQPLGVVKLLSGGLLVLCGWTVVEAVLYVLAGLVLAFGVLCLCEKIKRGVRCASAWQTVWEYALPALCIAIGILLLFHRSGMGNFVFIACGVLTVTIGGILLAEAFSKE